MECTNYDYYEIDAADIWNYEVISNLQGAPLPLNMAGTYSFIQKIFLRTDHKPFLSLQDTISNPVKKEQYDRQLIEFNNPESFLYILSHFFRENGFYSLTEKCVVNSTSISKHDFERLFAYKLRQYFDGLSSIENFLLFQLKKNFNSDTNEFSRFLKFIVLQYKAYFAEEIVRIVEEWRSNSCISNPALESSSTEVIPSTEPQLNEIPEPPTSIEVPNPELGNKKIPKNYEVIDGKFTRQEIHDFFSFLYKEKGVDNKPFVSKENTEEIFKYGIAIPPKELHKKYKLNVSQKAPKGIIEYCIHTFIKKHNIASKRRILKFFAFYFEDFSKALQDEKSFDNWCRNVTGGSKPAKMQFEDTEYLPYRIANPPLKHLTS